MEGKAFLYSEKRVLRIPRYKITPDQIFNEHRRLHRALEKSVWEPTAYQ